MKTNRKKNSGAVGEGRKIYTVIGMYLDNNQPWTVTARGETPMHAARSAMLSLLPQTIRRI